MFFFLTWYVKRTPYVVLILMYSRSSGFSRSVSRPVRLRQHSRHSFSLLPTFSSSPLLTSHSPTSSPSHPLPFSPSNPLTFSTIIYHYYIYFFLKIK